MAWDAGRWEILWRVGLKTGDRPEKFEIRGERILFQMAGEFCSMDVREGHWIVRRPATDADGGRAEEFRVPAGSAEIPAIHSLALPDDRTLVVADRSCRVLSWSLWPVGLVNVQAPPSADSRALALSADGRRLATTTNNALQVDVSSVSPSHRRLGFASTPTPILGACFVPGSDDLVVSEYAAREGRVSVWAPTTGATRAILEGTRRVFDLAPSPRTGEVLWTHDGDLYGWHGGDFEARLLATEIHGNALAVRPDGRFVAIGDDDRIQFLDRDAGRISAIRRTQWCCSKPLAFSPDCAALAVGLSCARHGLLFEFSSDLAPRLDGHVGSVTCATFTGDGRRLVTGSSDGTIRVWRRSSGRLLATLLALPGNEWVAWTPENFFVASEGAGEFLRWQLGDEFHPCAEFRSHFSRPGAIHLAIALPLQP